jgi:hypothetical protein
MTIATALPYKRILAPSPKMSLIMRFFGHPLVSEIYWWPLLILNGINTPIFGITRALNFPSATMQKLLTYRSK